MNVFGTLFLVVGVFIGFTLLSFKRTQFIGLFLSALSMAFIGFYIYQSNARNVAFEKVEIGQTEAEIIAAVGEPPRITDGTEWIDKGLKRRADELIPDCTKEYWYHSFFFPEALSFCFNENGYLIHKYRYVSW